MTDITELAQRLKLEVHRAVSDFNPQMNIKTRDLKELVEELESEKRICATWRKTAEANSEKLEKAQGMEAYWKTQCRGITDHCEELQARIAELESRTVKLPAERFCPAEYAGSQLWSETEVWNKAITACADALRAGGIKVETE